MATQKQSSISKAVSASHKETRGIFVDNDPDFRKDVASKCRGFTVLEIDETPDDESYGLDLQSNEYATFLEGLSAKGKAAASILKKLLDRDGIFKESYDPRSGITEKHVESLKEWVKEHKKNYKLLAVFDFDRTLTMMEGGHFIGTSIADWKERVKKTEKKKVLGKNQGYEQVRSVNGTPLFEYHWTRPSDGKVVHIPLPAGKNTRRFLDTFTAEGFAEYLAGGAKRLKMLQDMFDFLHEHSVEFFVLTNNTACMDSRGLLKEIVEVYTKGKPIRVLCGLEYGGQKSLAIKSNTTAHKFLCDAQKPRNKSRKTRRTKKTSS